MRKICYKIIIIYLSASFLIGCSSNSNADKRIVAEVNKYKMMAEDLKYELRNISYDDRGLLKTEKGRLQYMERLVEKEILLQEAQRQGLDRQKDFMKSIENYWEQALLKFLLQRKSKEISNLFHVYDNEVEKFYKDSDQARPLSEVKEDIKIILRQKKEREAMDAWIEELKGRSFIKINKDIMEEVFSREGGDYGK